MLVLSLGMMAIYPVLIAPLFNKFTPVSIPNRGSRVYCCLSMFVWKTYVVSSHLPWNCLKMWIMLLPRCNAVRIANIWVLLGISAQLPEGELRAKIEKLASSLKFPLKKLFVIDGSTRSSHSNVSWYTFVIRAQIMHGCSSASCFVDIQV